MAPSRKPLGVPPLPPLDDVPEPPVFIPKSRRDLADDEELLRMLGDEGLLEDSFRKEINAEDVKKESEREASNSISELLSADNIELKTDLFPKEVVAASQLLFMAERYGIEGLDHFVHNLFKLKVSMMRRGRREFVEGLHAEEKRERGPDMTPLSALLGRLGGG